MKILAVSDSECPALWDYFQPKRLADIDLILSCGDLDAEYLSFLATFCKGPVLYVPGNHDSGYEKKPPEGCICVDDNIFQYQGLRILGLGGSMRYKPGPYQYTERQMKVRTMKLWPKLCRRRGFDILLTHSPASGLGDSDSLAHRGFASFLPLLDRYEPAYFVHGHVHLNYNPGAKRIRQYGKTTVINAWERYVFEV